MDTEVEWIITHEKNEESYLYCGLDGDLNASNVLIVPTNAEQRWFWKVKNRYVRKDKFTY